MTVLVAPRAALFTGQLALPFTALKRAPSIHAAPRVPVQQRPIEREPRSRLCRAAGGAPLGGSGEAATGGGQ